MDENNIRRKHILQYIEERNNKEKVEPIEPKEFIYQDLGKDSKFNKDQRKKRMKRHHKGV